MNQTSAGRYSRITIVSERLRSSRRAFSLLDVSAVIVTVLLQGVQSPSGAVTGLTATTMRYGTPFVYWDAPKPTPSDFRLNWAMSDRDSAGMVDGSRRALTGIGAGAFARFYGV